MVVCHTNNILNPMWYTGTNVYGEEINYWQFISGMKNSVNSIVNVNQKAN